MAVMAAEARAPAAAGGQGLRLAALPSVQARVPAISAPMAPSSSQTCRAPLCGCRGSTCTLGLANHARRSASVTPRWLSCAAVGASRPPGTVRLASRPQPRTGRSAMHAAVKSQITMRWSAVIGRRSTGRAGMAAASSGIARMAAASPAPTRRGTIRGATVVAAPMAMPSSAASFAVSPGSATRMPAPPSSSSARGSMGQGSAKARGSSRAMTEAAGFSPKARVAGASARPRTAARMALPLSASMAAAASPTQSPMATHCVRARRVASSRSPSARAAPPASSAMAAIETPVVSARPGSAAQAALAMPHRPSATASQTAAPSGHGSARLARRCATTQSASATRPIGAIAFDCSTTASGATSSATATGRAGEPKVTPGRAVREARRPRARNARGMHMHHEQRAHGQRAR